MAALLLYGKAGLNEFNDEVVRHACCPSEAIDQLGCAGTNEIDTVTEAVGADATLQGHRIRQLFETATMPAQARGEVHLSELRLFAVFDACEQSKRLFPRRPRRKYTTRVRPRRAQPSTSVRSVKIISSIKKVLLARTRATPSCRTRAPPRAP